MPPTTSSEFFLSGTFSFGANYWASHAGPQMWKQWDRAVVADDFARLAAHGVTTLRVFPLWSDFQPINQLRTAVGNAMEIRFGEDPLPSGEIGRAGVSAEMLERFGLLVDLAEKEGIALFVGLITGWMSGRLYVPPALEGLNPITDPSSILWQVRFIKVLVHAFKSRPAIRAWDLGNECNVMGTATREQAWLWTSTLADAIRCTDPTRPVISGMHTLAVESGKPWSIYDQGELTDILTTHPYPLFTPHCNREPMDTIRPLLHSTAETCLYADLSGKPAFVEEIGNFGSYFCAEDKGARILRSVQASVWSHDCRGALWWCAFDQLSLPNAPHDWVPLERELGLLRENGEAKPLVAEITAFQDMLGRLPLRALPQRRIDAVCILTPGQDQWGAAYSAFILAKQAGFDVRFHYADRPLPDAGLYLLPSIGGLTPLSRQREIELSNKIAGGAALYLSADDGFVRDTYEITGLGFTGRHGRSAICEFEWDGESFAIAASTRFVLNDGQATVLARESNRNPVFSVSSHGKGKVFFLAAPLEKALAEKNEAFLPQETPYWKIYRHIAGEQLAARIIRKTSPALGITEHAVSEKETIAVIINYSPDQVTDALSLRKGVTLAAVLHGAESRDLRLHLAPNDYVVWHLTAGDTTGR